MTMVQTGSSSNASPDDTYFNDLSQQPPPRRNSNSDSANPASAEGSHSRDSAASKKIACILCRKRKLRCDGGRPKCGTCTRLNHDCGYDEVRKKSGPKRGYVKLLEARLQQVETLLKTQDPPEPRRNSQENERNASPTTSRAQPKFGNVAPQPATTQDASPIIQSTPTATSSDVFSFPNTSAELSMPDPFPWEVIGMGLEEPLPTQDVIDELHQIYFERIHSSQPLIHKNRYITATNLSPHMRPPVCLRYIMWCLAAGVSDKYDPLTDRFYRRARKYAELDEMKGHGESTITLAHCQAWFLIAVHEFKNMYFPRAWQSVGRACRLALMMGLNRLDGSGLDVKLCLPNPKDWTECEERRRAFWMCFCADRYASIGTGWPMIIDERDIMTLLPASEEAFNKSKPMDTPSLAQALSPTNIPALSAIAASAVVTCLLGRNLTHLHRPTPNDREADMSGEFWKRHRELDSIVSNLSLQLPDNLRLPVGLPDPVVVFLNMLLHTSVICLHQAAIFKASKNDLPDSVVMESRARCVTSAAETARIMRMTSHLDLARMNPFMAFCLYVAARVFIQYLRWKPNEPHMMASLQFLFAAMHALKRRNILTESFIAQLDVDLEGSGIDLGPRTVTPMPRGPCHVALNAEYEGGIKNSPLVEIRESHGGKANFRTSDYAATMYSQNQAPSSSYHQALSGMSHTSSDQNLNYPIPTRNKDTGGFSRLQPGGGGHAESVSPNSDMDCSPDGSSITTDGLTASKSRSNSYLDNSSHTSFTPPSVDDANCAPGAASMASASNMSKNSPSTLSTSASGITTPGTGLSAAASTDPVLFPDGGAAAAFSASLAAQAAAAAAAASGVQGEGYMMAAPFGLGSPGGFVGAGSAAWVDVTTVSGAATGGMTAGGMTDARWSEMLSSVQDWSSVPLEQVFEAIGRGDGGEG